MTLKSDSVFQNTTAFSDDGVRPFAFVQNSSDCSTNSSPFAATSHSRANSQTDGIA